MGVKNKPKEKEIVMPIVFPNAAGITREEIEKQQPIHYDAIFGIRAFRTGQWKGLWELVKISNDGKRQVITDANSRGMMINMLNRECMKIIIGA